MAEYRQIHTSIWKDSWFLDLEPDEKLLFIYLFSNESTSVAGIYKIATKVIAFETGLGQAVVKSILERFAQAGKVLVEGEVIWVRNLRKYNASSSLKVRERIARDLEQIPDGDLKTLYRQTYPLDRPSEEELSAAGRGGYKAGSRASQDRVRARLVSIRGERCEECRALGPVELHHVVPARAGGTLEDDNYLLLCAACHVKADAETRAKYPIPDPKYPIRQQEIPYPELASEQEQEHEQEQEQIESPADAAPDGAPLTFPQWQQALKDADHRGRPDLVRQFMQAYLPNNELPAHSYIAKTAKDVGGWGRLLDLLWQQVPRPPTGDALAFVRRVHEHRGNGRDSPRTEAQPLDRQVADIPKGWLQEPFDPDEELQL